MPLQSRRSSPPTGHLATLPVNPRGRCVRIASEVTYRCVPGASAWPRRSAVGAPNGGASRGDHCTKPAPTVMPTNLLLDVANDPASGEILAATSGVGTNGQGRRLRLGLQAPNNYS